MSAAASDNQVVAELPPPPRALFAPTADEMAELRRDQKLTLHDAVDSERNASTWGKIRLAAGVAGWVTAAFCAWGWMATYPLVREIHRFTVLNTADNTAAVFASTWDLPESKREELILGTAAQYVRACEGYTYITAQADYDYCAGLSYGGRLTEYVGVMNPENKEGVQAVLGASGWKRVSTGRPVRVAPNGINVPFIVVAARPGENPICARRIARLSYVPIAALPTTLHLQYPTADLLVFQMSVDRDDTPLDPAACRA